MLAAPNDLAYPVPFRGRLTVDLDACLSHVDHLHFRDPGLGVKRDLHVSVISGRGFRDLHHQEDVCRLRMGLGIEVRTGLQHGEVRLGLGVLPQPDGVLNAEDDLPSFLLARE